MTLKLARIDILRSKYKIDLGSKTEPFFRYSRK